MIYVSCQFETHIGRSDYSDYVRALQLDISGCDAGGNGILLGRIAADQVLISDAHVHGSTPDVTAQPRAAPQWQQSPSQVVVCQCSTKGR